MKERGGRKEHHANRETGLTNELEIIQMGKGGQEVSGSEGRVSKK